MWRHGERSCEEGAHGEGALAGRSHEELEGLGDRCEDLVQSHGVRVQLHWAHGE